MLRHIIQLFSVMLLTACVGSGLMNPPPPVDSPETSANITIHNAIPKHLLLDELIFSIDNVETYSFGKEDDFIFFLTQGDYIFGYKQGITGNKCEVDVEIHGGVSYVFYLKPDCDIEMQ